MRTILLFFIATISFYTSSFGQYFAVHCQIQCDCNQQNCDTLKIEIYDCTGLVICVYEIDSISASSTLIYGNNSQLIRKNYFDKVGRFISYTIFYYDSKNEWYSDSSFDDNNNFLFMNTIEKDSDIRLTIIHRYGPNSIHPKYVQRIFKDDKNIELANTICYSSQNCITQKYSYNNGLKTTMETWTLSMANALPILEETVSFVYDENRKLKMAVIKKGEKEECTSLLFYKTIQP